MKVLRSEAGMTLIELMVGIGILGIIIGPITASLMLGLISSTGTRERIADSAGAQVTSAYLLTDIESSDSLYLASQGATDCGASDTVLLRLQWDDADHTVVEPNKTTTVAYVDRLNSATGVHELRRIQCKGASSPTLVSDNKLILNLGTFNVGCDGAVPGPSSCPSATPTVVHVDITANANAVTQRANPTAYKPFDFSIEAARRVTGVLP